ncbi:hypothetical protein AAFF_G00104790 [Aldrovandia affinis]|uniref:Uncharacterized protein n=1 Tax=Aldrovandia affinis TaxID=143900 RepID=A0AAD7T330_9TELE|nr:hypothetical protein AAFF_G00104790 [Aldrovandia affinis]
MWSVACAAGRGVFRNMWIWLGKDGEGEGLFYLMTCLVSSAVLQTRRKSTILPRERCVCLQRAADVPPPHLNTTYFSTQPAGPRGDAPYPRERDGNAAGALYTHPAAPADANTPNRSSDPRSFSSRNIDTTTALNPWPFHANGPFPFQIEEQFKTQIETQIPRYFMLEMKNGERGIARIETEPC